MANKIVDEWQDFKDKFDKLRNNKDLRINKIIAGLDQTEDETLMVGTVLKLLVVEDELQSRIKELEELLGETPQEVAARLLNLCGHKNVDMRGFFNGQ